jgi:flagellar basal body P-ring formation protein FlgA
MKIFKEASLILLLLLPFKLSTAEPAEARQDHLTITRNVEQFLRDQTIGLPGQVSITIGNIDSRLNLKACIFPEPFLPQGSRAWGKTTVGIRCTAPVSWTIYLQATVKVISNYIAIATSLSQGKIIAPHDIVKLKGDLSSLPNGIITEESQAVGRTLAISLTSGTPLRFDALRNQFVIQQSQLVRLISTGSGFSVSTEARALANANEGQIIPVKTTSGQLITGVAKAGGVVEVHF